MSYNDKARLEDWRNIEASKQYLRFYPTKTLIRLWRKGDITAEELKSLVKPCHLPKELRT